MVLREERVVTSFLPLFCNFAQIITMANNKIFSKLLTNKTRRSKLTIGNQNEFSGIIADPIRVDSVVTELTSANADDFTYRPNVIGLESATKTLTSAESGSVVFLNRAGGITVTLPAPVAGLTYEFYVGTSVTATAYKIITDAATTFLVGAITNVDTDTSNAVAAFTADGTAHVAITMNGSTTGGLRGSYFKLTCISPTRWLITGTNLGSGIVATPFANS